MYFLLQTPTFFQGTLFAALAFCNLIFNWLLMLQSFNILSHVDVLVNICNPETLFTAFSNHQEAFQMNGVATTSGVYS